MNSVKTSVLAVVLCAVSGAAALGQVMSPLEFQPSSYGGGGAPTPQVATSGARSAQAWQRIYVDGKQVVVPAAPRSPDTTTNGALVPAGDQVTKLPYLKYRRTITGQVRIAPYAPGYILAPNELPQRTPAMKTFMSSHPHSKQNVQQTEYLGYYDEMPEILANDIKWYHQVLGFPAPEWGKAYCPGCHAQLPSPLVWHDGACPQCDGFQDTSMKASGVQRENRLYQSMPSPRFEAIDSPAAKMMNAASEEEAPGTAWSRSANHKQ